MNAPTPEAMRAMGYASHAVPAKLSPEAYAAKLAWIGVTEAQCPPNYDWSDSRSAAAWERVADLIRQGGV